jgi:hypothetical protein
MTFVIASMVAIMITKVPAMVIANKVALNVRINFSKYKSIHVRPTDLNGLFQKLDLFLR